MATNPDAEEPTCQECLVLRMQDCRRKRPHRLSGRGERHAQQKLIDTCGPSKMSESIAP